MIRELTYDPVFDAQTHFLPLMDSMARQTQPVKRRCD